MALHVTTVVLALVYSVGGTRPTNSCPQSKPCECRNEGLLRSETVVNCQNQKLYEIPSFEGIGAVRKVNLVHNKITEVSDNDFAGISSDQIDLSDNLLESMDEHAFNGVENSLKTLTLKSNRFSRIPSKSLKALAKLKELNLDNNQELRQINASAFEGLSQLETLSLKACSLIRLHENAFVGLTNLRELRLYENHLKEISPVLFLSLTNLRDLDLGHNGLDHVPARAFRYVTSLSLSMNNFSSEVSFDPEAFDSVSDILERLKLGRCLMRKIPNRALKRLRSLKELDLSFNQIRVIESGDLAGLPRLERLTLDGNTDVRLRPHAFSQVANTLQRLSMREINLVALPLNPLQDLLALQWLDISKNKFIAFRAGALEGICATRLEISHSTLQTISKQAFRNTPNDLRVNLNGNVISGMQFLRLPCKFMEVHMDLNCDCALDELLMTRRVRLNGKCILPRALEGVTIDSDAYNLINGKKCERNSSKSESAQRPSCPSFNPSETGMFSPSRCFTVSPHKSRGKFGASHVSAFSASPLLALFLVAIISLGVCDV